MAQIPSQDSLVGTIRLRVMWMGVIGWLAGLGTGCSSQQGPELLTLRADQYPAAFDAALESARSSGMPAALRDRRAGLIQTDPKVAGSLLEPWRTDNAGFSQALENTIAHQRRRARFEFSPAAYRLNGITPEPAKALAATYQATRPGEPPATATGPDVVGVNQTPIDLTLFNGDLELRVWVFIDRAQTPGIRRSTWTRRKTSKSTIITPEGEAPLPDSTYWVPIKRDIAYEQRLLRDIEKQLAGGSREGREETPQ